MLKLTTKNIVTIGILVAIEIVLNRFLSISAWNIKVGFQFVPVVAGALLYGPVGGALVGGLGDLIGALLFPIGAYFPGFTITAAAMGAVHGLFLQKNQSSLRIVLAVLINQLFWGLIVNSFWISVLYGSPYKALLSTRILQCAVLAPVQIVVIHILSTSLLKVGIKKHVA